MVAQRFCDAENLVGQFSGWPKDQCPRAFGASCYSFHLLLILQQLNLQRQRRLSDLASCLCLLHGSA